MARKKARSYRTFAQADKLRILQEADACTDWRELRALVEREGLTRITLGQWRRARAAWTGASPQLEAGGELASRAEAQAARFVRVQAEQTLLLQDMLQELRRIRPPMKPLPPFAAQGLVDTRGKTWEQIKGEVVAAVMHAVKGNRAAGARQLGVSKSLKWRRGRLYLDASLKAQERMRTELRARTQRTWLSLPEMVEDLNPYIRGARQYFRRIRRRTLSKLDFFMRQRIARWWARKHRHTRPAWWLLAGKALSRQYGLERWYFPRTLRTADSRLAT